MAPDPRNILFNPPSLYKDLTTAIGPLCAVAVAAEPIIMNHTRNVRQCAVVTSSHDDGKGGKRRRKKGRNILASRTKKRKRTLALDL